MCGVPAPGVEGPVVSCEPVLCPMCTFSNAGTATSCAICGSVIPSSYATSTSASSSGSGSGSGSEIHETGSAAAGNSNLSSQLWSSSILLCSYLTFQL